MTQQIPRLYKQQDGQLLGPGLVVPVLLFFSQPCYLFRHFPVQPFFHFPFTTTGSHRQIGGPVVGELISSQLSVQHRKAVWSRIFSRLRFCVRSRYWAAFNVPRSPIWYTRMSWHVELSADRGWISRNRQHSCALCLLTSHWRSVSDEWTTANSATYKT